MVISKSATDTYFRVSSRLPDLIRGSGRVRYVRCFLLINSKGGGPAAIPAFPRSVDRTSRWIGERRDCGCTSRIGHKQQPRASGGGSAGLPPSTLLHPP